MTETEAATAIESLAQRANATTPKRPSALAMFGQHLEVVATRLVALEKRVAEMEKKHG
jgi:hypothetical protein